MKSQSLEQELEILLSKNLNFYLNKFPSFEVNKIRKIVLFGAGQMGGIYKNFFERLNIQVLCFCDNDSNKAGKKINGVRIIGINSLVKYPKNTPIIITSIFDEDIAEQLKELKFNKVWSHSFLASFYNDLFPNPYWSNPIGDILKNKKKITKVIKLLKDYQSKKVFLNIIKYRLFLESHYIKGIESNSISEYFEKKIIKLSEKEIFVDGGAFDGDTIARFIKFSKNKFEKIFAFEPDSYSFSKLEKYIKHLRDSRVKIFKVGLGEENKMIKFGDDGTLGSRADETANQLIEIVSLNEQILNDSASFIKLDIEGAEEEAIKGANDIIKKHNPKLAVCVYHKPTDLWDLPLLIKNINSNYRFYLRHYSKFLYDTVFYAVPKLKNE